MPAKPRSLPVPIPPRQARSKYLGSQPPPPGEECRFRRKSPNKVRANGNPSSKGISVTSILDRSRPKREAREQGSKGARAQPPIQGVHHALRATTQGTVPRLIAFGETTLNVQAPTFVRVSSNPPPEEDQGCCATSSHVESRRDSCSQPYRSPSRIPFSRTSPVIVTPRCYKVKETKVSGKLASRERGWGP